MNVYLYTAQIRCKTISKSAYYNIIYYYRLAFWDFKSPCDVHKRLFVRLVTVISIYK